MVGLTCADGVRAKRYALRTGRTAIASRDVDDASLRESLYGRRSAPSLLLDTSETRVPQAATQILLSVRSTGVG